MSDDFGRCFEDMDVEAFINMRDWLEKALTAHGAKVDGSGIGAGRADISIELDGCRFNVAIRPLSGKIIKCKDMDGNLMSDEKTILPEGLYKKTRA